MTPVELLVLICALVVLRFLVGWAPVRVRLAPAGQLDGEHENLVSVVREYLDAFIIAGLVALFLITFVVRTFYIPSGSMEPTLQINDVLLVNEFEYRFTHPRHGDIVVFKPPIRAPSEFIKRVIGIPGDRLKVQDGILYLNGHALSEPYIAQRPAYDLEIKNYGMYVDGVRIDSESANIPPRSQWKHSDQIPNNCYLMFGDNRNDSEDSHIWGCAQADGTFASGPLRGKQAQFTGHAFFLFWPLNRIRILQSG